MIKYDLGNLFYIDDKCNNKVMNNSRNWDSKLGMLFLEIVSKIFLVDLNENKLFDILRRKFLDDCFLVYEFFVFLG